MGGGAIFDRIYPASLKLRRGRQEAFLKIITYLETDDLKGVLYFFHKIHPVPL